LLFPTKGWSGLTLRTFDVEKRQWLIYWVSSATGRLEAPVVGGFDGDHGEFYGEDVEGGRPVKVCLSRVLSRVPVEGACRGCHPFVEVRLSRGPQPAERSGAVW
jgi:hypothetical protein